MRDLVIALLCAVLATAQPTCTDDLRAQLPKATLEDITLPKDADLSAARDIFSRYGVLVVRGLMAEHAPRVRDAATAAFHKSVELMEAGHIEAVQNDDNVVGWVTPDQTLFIPAPEGHVRDRQVMVLALDYQSDASMLQAATEPKVLDLLEAMLGWTRIETFGKGQCFYKEAIQNARTLGGISAKMAGPNATTDERIGAGIQPGGNPKYLHQDSAYFMFAHEGAVATFSFAVDTSGELDNGPLYVVPGSHKLGHLEHIDTPSHLGVSGDWTFDDALRIDGKAGDCVFFHIHALHGSTPNRSPNPRPVFINRYLEASDYQTYFGTDARMREKAKAEYEEGVRLGRKPEKERGIMVRGRREWTGQTTWRMDARVNH